MRAYIIRRLAIFPVFLFVVSVVTFIVIRSLPGDAALVNLGIGNAACTECREQIREELGLNKPLPEQYWIWLSNAVTGDFGNSTVHKREIAPEVADRLLNTLEITIAAVLFTVLLGVPLGAISAIRSGGVTDYAARGVAILGLSIPNFWIATLVVILPAIWWGWTPAGEWLDWSDSVPGHLRVVALPAAVLAISSAAYVARVTRSSLLEVMRTDFVRTARAKGLAEQVVMARHVFRNSLVTLLTIIGLQAGVLLGGAVVVEAVFGVPGLGLMAQQAVIARDFQTLQALTVLFALWFITVQLIVDIAYAWVDPRIRVG
jgi:peptide/nickel transport system permease protein